MIKNFILLLASLWWGWTVLVDFVIVPTVFQTVNEFFMSGQLAIALFSKLNFFEVIVSSALVALSVMYFNQHKRGKIQLALSFSAWVIVMIYFSYLTSKITDLTLLWQKADLSNEMGIAGIVDIQQEHQFYHRVYVGLDSLKLLILSFIIGLGLFRKDHA